MFLTKNLAIAGDLGGVYRGEANTSIYTFMGGPQLCFGGRVSPFLEALFGGTKFAFTAAGSTNVSDTFFSYALGGGVDVQATNGIAIRIIRLDYLHVRGGAGPANNVRFTPGIVFRF